MLTYGLFSCVFPSPGYGANCCCCHQVHENMLLCETEMVANNDLKNTCAHVENSINTFFLALSPC